jgi:hypothetical protein
VILPMVLAPPRMARMGHVGLQGDARVVMKLLAIGPTAVHANRRAGGRLVNELRFTGEAGPRAEVPAHPLRVHPPVLRQVAVRRPQGLSLAS